MQVPKGSLGRRRGFQSGGGGSGPRGFGQGASLRGQDATFGHGRHKGTVRRVDQHRVGGVFRQKGLYRFIQQGGVDLLLEKVLWIRHHLIKRNAIVPVGFPAQALQTGRQGPKYFGVFQWFFGFGS